MNAKNIGKRILKARQETKTSQVMLAKMIGMGQKSISRYELQICIPETITLEKIAKALDRPIEYFFEDYKKIETSIEERVTNLELQLEILLDQLKEIINERSTKNN